MQQKDDTTRYLKKFHIIETTTELPIQGQVRDPEDLYIFFKDMHDENVPKVIGIYLDQNNLFLGHQVFLGYTSATFDTSMLYYYYFLFQAKKFTLVINHPSGEPTPDADDQQLMRSLLNDSQSLSFKPFFEDFIVLGGNKYFSMSTNNGTACHCGHQEYIPQ